MQNIMLVLPVTPTAPIPKAYEKGWIYFDTFDSSDAVFRGADVELHLQTKGYALVDAEALDRLRHHRPTPS